MSIVTEVALEDAAVAVKLIVSQPRGQEVRGLEAGPGVVTNYLRERKHVYIDLEYELSVPDLGEVAGAGVLEHGVPQPVAGLGQVRPVNTVTVPEHDLRLNETFYKYRLLIGRDSPGGLRGCWPGTGRGRALGP